MLEVWPGCEVEGFLGGRVGLCVQHSACGWLVGEEKEDVVSTDEVLSTYEKQRLESERDWYRLGLWAAITAFLCLMCGCAGYNRGELDAMNEALKYGHAKTVQYNALVGGSVQVRERIEWNHKCAGEVGK